MKMVEVSVEQGNVQANYQYQKMKDAIDTWIVMPLTTGALTPIEINVRSEDEYGEVRVIRIKDVTK